MARRRGPGDRLAYLGILVAVVGLGVFAWATRHPDSPLIDRARDWPVVGPAVAAFQDTWLPPPVGSSEAPSLDRSPPGPPFPSAADPGLVLYRQADGSLGPELPSQVARDEVWLEQGTELRAEPRDDASVVMRLPALSNLQVLERAEGGEWLRLLRRGRPAGWVRATVAREPVIPSGRLPVLPVPSRPADPERLERARRLLGETVREGRLGSHPLLTDIDAPGLVALLDAVTASTEAVYRERTGLAPVGPGRETVLLFEADDAFRRFRDDEEALHGLEPTGLAVPGLVALATGARRDAEVASILVHELVHQLNRRSLGPALPPWLEEGLADDLALGRIEADGTLVPGSLGGWQSPGVEPGAIRLGGGRAALARLVERSYRPPGAPGALPDLERLTALDARRFAGGADAAERYAHAAFFVRYLLDDPERAEAFRAWLAAVATGGPTDADTLRQRLDRPWDRLDAGFRAWLQLRDRGMG